MIKIKNYFRPVDKQYGEDLKEILVSIIKNKNLKNLEKTLYLHKRSKLFIIEYEKFRRYMDSNINFYEAWSKSFTDPLMIYIIQHSDVDCLLHYVNEKVKFWESFFQKNTYSFILFLMSILFYQFSKFIFYYANSRLLIYYILANVFVVIFNYMLLVFFIAYIYRQYCTKCLFVKYFEQKVSIDELLRLKNKINIDSIIDKIKKNKFYKREMLWENLQFYWKIILLNPILISFIITVLSMGFFLIVVWQIFYISMNEVSMLI